MKKIYLRLLATASILFSVAVILMFSGVLKMFTISSNANEPNQMMGSRIFITNLKSPKVNDFICFEFTDPVFGKAIRTYRLCATEGDVIEIRKGVLFRNGKNADEGIRISHTYKIPMAAFLALRQSKAFNKNTLAIPVSQDTMQTFLEDGLVKSEGLDAKREIQSPGSEDKYIYKVYGQNWNRDHFGPLKIPKGKIFVLGDNRDNAEDSRYLGLIDQSAIVGVAL
jgi:signal peptidase I